MHFGEEHEHPPPPPTVIALTNYADDMVALVHLVCMHHMESGRKSKERENLGRKKSDLTAGVWAGASS